MRTNLLCGLTLAALTFSTQAALILDEPFNYPDGSLVTVTTDWTTTSGTTGQVDVAGGKITVTQTESEDVNRLVPGGPYSNGVLYASFIVNFSLLPSGNGTYFAHLKDDSVSGFRCKVFATTTNLGTATGKFQVGVTRGLVNAPAMIPKDLSLGSNYTLVIRYDCATTASTLWIDPNNESSASDRAEGTDTSTSFLPIYAFGLRQSLSSGSGMGTMTVDDLKIATTFCEVVSCGSTTLNPPNISGIADQYIAMNSATLAIPFTVTDGETAAAALIVTAVSDNPTLAPNNPANIALSGTDSNRTVTVTPATGRQGVATITISALDTDNNVTMRSFLVIVGAPTISSVANQITAINTPTAPIPFLVGDAETAPGALSVSMYSLNPSLIPPGNVSFTVSGSNRTAVITPAAGLSGLAQIGFVVSDGSTTASNSFTLTVAPALGLDTSDGFTYADGSLDTNSSFAWNVHSGTPGEMRVLNNQVIVSSNLTEDASTFVGFSTPQGYFTTSEGWVVYVSFTVNFSAMPGAASGDYFAHFRDTGTLNYRGRVFATTNGAAPGTYRLGIANATATPSAVASNNLALGATYTVMVRYNVGTAESRLWINPTSEQSPSLDATDPAVPTPVYTYSFRENTGIGVLAADNLKLAGTFALAFNTPNWPPTISDIADQTTTFNTATPAIPFTVGDVETAAGSLTPSGASANTALVPVGNIAFSGGGANRFVTVTPVTGQSGTTLITVRITDAGGQTASDTFLLTVLAPNNPPVISAIPDQSTVIDTPIPAIPFTVYDLESPAPSLHVRGTSSDQAVVSDGSIVFTTDASGSNRTVTVTPATGATGTVAITVFVDDGVFTNSRGFSLSVNLGLLLADTFSYPDGSIVTNSDFFWNAHSGTTGQTQVASGKLDLSGSQSEDINAVLTNAPYAPASGAVLYAGFTVNFTALPGSQYFAHFRDTSTGFRGRIFATLSNAAPASFRLGIANNAGTLGATNPPLAQDLALNTPYRVVMRYNVGTGFSTLWVNPAAETDPSVTATDTPSTLAISTFAFRQATGIGTMTADDLKVGTTFGTVLGSTPAQPELTIVLTGPDSLRISWSKSASDAGYLLQRTGTLPGGWSNYGDQGTIEGNEKIVTIRPAAGNGFFQLARPL